MPTVITVQGSCTERYPAERALVRLTIGINGPDRDAVLASATTTVADVTASIEARHDATAGPIEWFSVDQLRMWAQRPWNQDGAQLPLVHHAEIGVKARFSDFDALAEWLTTTAGLDGVTVEGVEWTLTDATRIAATTDVRSRAVRDAADKALAFAQAIGLSTVTAVAIADPGMLGSGSGSGEGGGIMEKGMMMRASFSADAGRPLAFTPEEIEVSATVDARFEAS